MLAREGLIARTAWHRRIAQTRRSHMWTWTSWFWPSVWAYDSIGHYVTLRFLGYNKPPRPYLVTALKLALRAFVGKSATLLLPRQQDDVTTITYSWVLADGVDGVCEGHDLYFGRFDDKALATTLRIVSEVGALDDRQRARLLDSGCAVITWQPDILRPLKAAWILLKGLLTRQIAARDVLRHVDAKFIDAQLIGRRFDRFLDQQSSVKRFIVAYEAQPIQQRFLDTCNRRGIETTGYLHSTLVPFPSDVTFSPVAPQQLWVHGNSYPAILTKYLGWPSDRIKIIDSLRYHRGRTFTPKVFLPISLGDTERLLTEFETLLRGLRDPIRPLEVGIHPGRLDDPRHQEFAKQLQQLFEEQSDHFDADGTPTCVVFGITSALFEALENRYQVINLIEDPILEVYDPDLFGGLDRTRLTDHCYAYRLTAPGSYIRFGSGGFALDM